MAAKPAETDASGTQRIRAICAIAAFALLGLATWQATDVFTRPVVSEVPISVEQQKLLHVIEPLAGAGNVRLSVRRAGAGSRDFLVMIDTSATAARGLGEDIESILTKAAGFSTANGDTLTVQEFAFAGGVTARPDAQDLAQLGIMGLLVFLLSWGAFAPAPSRAAPDVTSRRKSKRNELEEAPRRTRPVAVDLSPAETSRVSAAAKAAQKNPSETANVIRAWMRNPETDS